MTQASDTAESVDVAARLVVELLNTAFSLNGAFTSLLEDWPENAFPGEDPAAVLIEMMAGSSLPAIEKAGEAECRAATALIEAVRERILDDLRAAVHLAKPDDEVLL